MRFGLFYTIIATLFLAVLSSYAVAQETVSARVRVQDTYDRLVLPWAEKTEYSLSKDGNRILIRFGRAGTIDTSAILSQARNIEKIETVSAAGEPLQLAITIPSGSRFRDFVIDHKVIIDVYDPPGVKRDPQPQTAQATIPSTKQDNQKTASKSEPVSAKAIPQPEKQEPHQQNQPPLPKAADPEAVSIPVEKVETAPIPAQKIQPHVITLTTTTNFGMAAFQRAGWLWVVLDDPAIPVEPVLAGPQKERFKTFEKFPVDGGIAYRLDLPEGLHVYGEGGGLSWRIVLTPNPRRIESAAVQITQEGTASTLSWPLTQMQKTIRFNDPVVGDDIVVITAPQADRVGGNARHFVDLDQLDSRVGLAFLPKRDDVIARVLPDRVLIEGERALALADPQEFRSSKIRNSVSTKPGDQMPTADAAVGDNQTKTADNQDVPGSKPAPVEGKFIFNFPGWEMGGIHALIENRRALMLELGDKDEEERAADLITMAKMSIANNRGYEAMGLLRAAGQIVPPLEDSAEYKALLAAASALSGRFSESFLALNDDRLKQFDDIGYWRTFTLAGLEDWNQAIQSLPARFDVIASYPDVIKFPLALALAETALRGGKVPVAEGIMGMLEPKLSDRPLHDQSAWNYLAGEAQRQLGNPQKAKEYWQPLVAGKDNMYRAKAGLALVRLELEQKEIKPEQAIDRLEGLRYAWRGDDLETQINFRLGQLYIDNKEYLKGLSVLRNAVSIASTSEGARTITDYMTKAFRNIFNTDQLKTMSPLDAISLYEEFKELTPAGEEGDRFVEKLAERLVDANLLGRAAALLDYQVNHRLSGDKKAEIAVRLAAIRLLDDNPDGALRSLEIAQNVLSKVEPESGAPKNQAENIDLLDGQAPQPQAALTSNGELQRQVDLLKARALSMQKKTDEALAVLEKIRLDPDVNRLRADIAWEAGRWEEAAVALNDLLLEEDILPSRALTPYQTSLIMNRAIALNLSANRVALSNLRERYGDLMEKTNKGQLFEIVTRPRRPDMIGSREAIERMISELSLFQGFLDGYKKITDKEAPATTSQQESTATEPSKSGQSQPDGQIKNQPEAEVEKPE